MCAGTSTCVGVSTCVCACTGVCEGTRQGACPRPGASPAGCSEAPPAAPRSRAGAVPASPCGGRDRQRWESPARAPPPSSEPAFPARRQPGGAGFRAGSAAGLRVSASPCPIPSAEPSGGSCPVSRNGPGSCHRCPALHGGPMLPGERWAMLHPRHGPAQPPCRLSHTGHCHRVTASPR